MLLPPLTSNATEEDNQRPKSEIFEPKAYVVKNGGKGHVCFSPEGGITIGQIISDYHYLWAYTLSLEKEIVSYKRELHFSQKDAKLWEEQAFELKTRGDLYLSSYEMERESLIKYRKSQQAKERWSWVPWSLSAAVAVVFGVIYIAK